MKFLLLIAVFCVVPCAFQDVWDDYDTWYDDLNDDVVLPENIDLPKDDQAIEPELVENDGNKEFHAADYGGEDNYRDYEIEDNRDEVKNKLEKEGEQNQDLAHNDDNFDSAIQDFDALVQRIINNDHLSKDVNDNVLEEDDMSPMDLNDLLPDDFLETDNNKNIDDIAIPAIALDKDVINDVVDENNVSKEVQDNNREEDNKDLQSDIQDTRDETRQLLEEFDSEFDENANSDAKEVPETDAQSNLQDVMDETRQILENTNTNFDENKDTEEKPNVDILDAKIQDELKETVDETQQILENRNNDFDENNDANDEQAIAEIEPDMKEIMEETRQILEETNSNFDETHNDQDNEQNFEESVQDIPVLQEEINDDEISEFQFQFEKEYEDLNEDLDELYNTWRKLRLENSDEANESANNDEEVKVEVNADDDLNRDYDNIGEDTKDKDFDYEGEARILDTRNDYYESLMDKNLSDLFQEFLDEDNGDENLVSAESMENNADEVIKESGQILQDEFGLVIDSNEENKEDGAKIIVPQLNVEENEDMKKSSEKLEDEPEADKINMPVEVSKVEATKATKDVDDLTSSELDQLTQQFVLLHDSELNMEGDDTPIHITLTADETVVITSPNYPNSYPTDQTVVDWILEGLGTGIEVNITDLAINSAQGHFLMIKPGQSDASGDSGIVFAYRINSERRYRFRDVNKMFVRFNPLGGMSFSRGFQLSARMIEPPAGENDEDIPEPEFLIPEPQHTATLLLAGVNSTEFLELKDEFQRLLADMATMYINANNIDPGMNSTAVVTQITRSYVCNINWPGFDSCVQVTFGVPLVYEDEDSPSRLTEDELMEMWDTYASRDPFAARLSQMGISDYTVPQEAKILTVWVVVGVGVVIAAAMLGFALWRYSCIDNYTRMQEYSDTDSIVDKKRGLDMYPTPHQTLPPLYTENDYKWADRTFDDSTRVDMGGFTNNTFTRDDVSSESEEDVVVSRDRNGFKPRDFSAV